MVLVLAEDNNVTHREVAGGDWLPGRAGRDYRERGPYGENRGFLRLLDDP